MNKNMNIFKELQEFAKDLTLLVVEDDRLLNEELCEISRLFFLDVKCAYNGVEALAIYEKNLVDIILSDITMPDMNGIELCKKIKSINDEQNIIVLSAHNEVEYFVELIDLGIRQFVHKPFKHEEFLYRVLKVCEQISLTKFYNSDSKDIVNHEPCAPVVVKKNIQKVPDIISKKQVSSKNFLNKLQKESDDWNLMSEDIVTLVEISEDFELYVNQIYIGNLSKELLVKMSFLLKKMRGILLQINFMKDMAQIFFELATFVEEIDFDSLEQEQKDKFKMLEFIYDDISRFVQTVFVYKDTIDIYYLKDSLKSSVEQLKISVLNSPMQEEELEFF